MDKKENNRPNFLIKNRGLIEDIFLYFILVIIIGLSSWFLMKTHFDIEKSLPKPAERQIFLDVLNDKSIQQNEPGAEKVNKNYLVYLQAQSNLNKNRYDLGTQLVLANMMRKNIGFLIGTLLALIGCIVIVRRIRNMEVSAEGNAAGQQIKILTASPGVLLVLMGSIIILTTIFRQDTVNITDFEPASPFVTTNGEKKLNEETKKEVDEELDDVEKEINSSLNNTNKQ